MQKEVSMRIEHIALWAEDIERIKNFYVKYFGAFPGERYHNPARKFTSYFLSFPESGTRLEIMNSLDFKRHTSQGVPTGYAHLAISVESDSQVEIMTETLRSNGVTILSEPRITGDGYYESSIEDPEGNIIEIMSESRD